MIYVKNISGITKTWVGQEIASNTYFAIPSIDQIRWATSTTVLTALASSELLVAKDASGTTDITNIDIAIRTLQSNIPQEVLLSPFSTKTISNKSLFTRVHGASTPLEIGQNTASFVIPYPQVKFNELEIFGCLKGDRVDLKILDSAAGSYSGTPNLVLNQFGYGVYLPDTTYRRHSAYDADLYYGMQIQIVYTSSTANTAYFNFILHELKS